MVDSAVDLVSKIVMFFVQKNMNKQSEKYPVGKRRLEPISVLGISMLLIISSILVIAQSVSSMIDLFDPSNENALQQLQLMVSKHGDELSNMQPHLDKLEHHIIPTKVTFSALSSIMMSTVILCKALLWIYCRRFNESAIVKILSDDHFNDALSNIIALAAFLIATSSKLNPGGNDKKFSCIDQIGAIIVGVYIVYGWIKLAKTEISLLVGRVADEHELDELNRVCAAYNRKSRNWKQYQMKLDSVTAYHNGINIVAEVDIILDKTTPLAVAHDICLGLQHEIERIVWIERAYVHADDIPEPMDEIAHIV